MIGKFIDEAKKNAREITGMEFWVLESLSRPLEGFRSTSVIFDRMAGNDMVMRAKIADSLAGLAKHGLIETKWGGSVKVEGSDMHQVSKYAKRSDLGQEVIHEIYRDKKLRARALLLALGARPAEVIIHEGIDVLSKLYEKIDVSDKSFQIEQRDSSQKQSK